MGTGRGREVQKEAGGGKERSQFLYPADLSLLCDASGTGAPQPNYSFSFLVNHVSGLQASHSQGQSKAMAEKYTLATVPQ